jgi:hypothetical protein
MKVLKAGTRLRSAVCDAEVMVIRATPAAVSVTCGGAEMIGMADPKASAVIDAAHAAGCLVGKRYVDVNDQFEFLCTKGGKGSLALDGATLTVKQAKALPSSD